MQKSAHKSLYEHIETADYETHKTLMGNIKIAHSCYKDDPLNKSCDMKVSLL